MRPYSGPQPLDAELLDRRVVRLWGPLDDSTVAKACAEMMALDATGDEAVQLYVGSTGGPVHSAMSLIDTMDLLGVPVYVTCLGRAEGAAVGVVAAGARRVAAPHAQFHLTEPEVSVSGNANQLAAWAEHHRVELERFVQRLARGNRAPGRAPGSRPVARLLARCRGGTALRAGRRDLGPGAGLRPSLG